MNIPQKAYKVYAGHLGCFNLSTVGDVRYFIRQGFKVQAWYGYEVRECTVFCNTQNTTYAYMSSEWVFFSIVLLIFNKLATYIRKFKKYVYMCTRLFVRQACVSIVL
jgi:hypothetical protein